MKCLEKLADSREVPSVVETYTLDGWIPGSKLRWMASADQHIGSLRNDLGEEGSIERAQQAFDEFIEAVIEYKPQVVFLVGDAYMHKSVTAAEQQCWNAFVTRLLQLTFVVLQPGNHDFLSKSMTTVDYFQKFADESLLNNFSMASYDSKLVKFKNKDDSEEFTVLNCPCLTPLYLEEVEQANVVLYHGNVHGAIMDNGYKFKEEEDNRVRMPFTKADLWILGDIHKRQWVADNAFYTASMYQTKFSEDPEKGYVRGTLDCGGEKVRFTAEHINLKTPYQLKTITIKSNDEIPEDWSKYEDYYLRVLTDINVTADIQYPANVIKRGLLGSISFEGPDSEVDVEISMDGQILENLEFLENIFQGADEFLEMLNEQTDLELSPEEMNLALTELEEIRRDNQL